MKINFKKAIADGLFMYNLSMTNRPITKADYEEMQSILHGCNS